MQPHQEGGRTMQQTGQRSGSNRRKLYIARTGDCVLRSRPGGLAQLEKVVVSASLLCEHGETASCATYTLQKSFSSRKHADAGSGCGKPVCQGLWQQRTSPSAGLCFPLSPHSSCSSSYNTDAEVSAMSAVCLLFCFGDWILHKISGRDYKCQTPRPCMCCTANIMF